MRIDNIKLRIDEDETRLREIVEKKLRGRCHYLKILKKSLDARDNSDIRWVYSVDADLKPKKEVKIVLSQTNAREKRIVIVGSGPAGLFCAVRLVDRGFKPIILERGGSVEERVKQNKRFFKEKILDENCNIQFGEGGAGTFSDGKLNTQTNSPLNHDVLEIFVRFGAPEEILYLNKPHIGSDNLQKILVNIRKYIIERGGNFYFHQKFCGIKMKDGALFAVNSENTKSGEINEIPADILVLAIGHSSRDTFKMLFDSGMFMEQRKFAVGFRIEHLQEKIGYAQYSAWHKLLPPADYKLVSHAGERTVFTFCMCPGGYVIPSASEFGGVVTNGMSNYARDGINANSAVLAQVKKEDFGSHVLDGVEFQRKIEQAAFLAGGSDFSAPVQRVEDFLNGKKSCGFGDVLPTYSAGVTFFDLNKLFEEKISYSLRSGIVDMDRRLKGFADPDAVLTGVETRFSSPVRIVRGDNFESITHPGVFPCGEGCGYSGGITSSAADGLRIAERIFDKFSN